VRAFSSGSDGRPGSQTTLHGSTPLQALTVSWPSPCPFAKKLIPIWATTPGICAFGLRMFGPQGTSVHATLTPCLTPSLIVGVSGPPSFGPMNQASYFFETRASRSWLICLFVVNCASNTVSLTLPCFFAASWTPWSAAVQ
jgi:hypothetical protein